jgi:hypothetical protein
MIYADFLAGANHGPWRSEDAAVLDDEILQVSCLEIDSRNSSKA